MNIKNILSKYKLKIILYLCFTGVIASLEATIPVILGKMIDSVTNKVFSALIFFAIFYFVIYIIKEVIGYFSNMIYNKIESNISFKINHRVIRHLQKYSMIYTSNLHPGELSQRINSDSNTIARFYLESISSIFTYIVSLIYYMFILIHIDYTLTFVIFSLVIFDSILYIIFQSRIYNKSFQQKSEEAAFFNLLLLQITRIKSIKILSINEKMKIELVNRFKKYINKIIKIENFYYLYGSIENVIQIIFDIVAIIFCGLKVIRNEITIGEFTVVTAMLTYSMSAIKGFIDIGKEYQDMKSSYDNLQYYLNVKNKSGDIEINNVSSLELKNIEFYRNNEKVISNLSFYINDSGIYQIVGENGKGKTTIIDLISGLFNYEYDGDIIYNKTYNLKSLNIESLIKNHISYMEENTFILDDTFKNNIEISEKYNLEVLMEILNKSSAISLKRLYLTYKDKYLSSDERNLSTGEIKQLGILRTISKKASLYIFDEPISNLDENIVAEFNEIIRVLSNDNIVIVISHDNRILNDKIIMFNS